MTLKSILLSFCIISQSYAQLSRMEPSEWWIGMENPNLQVLLYGKNIGQSTVQLHHPGVKLLKVYKAESPNYLFVDLLISKEAKAGKVPIKVGSSSHYLQLLPRKVGSKTRVGFGPADAIYLITPDRFANGDSQNDQIAGYSDGPNRKEEYGRHGGDLLGIRQQLGYIKNLGMTAIWPMPIEENAMEQWSYHGYAITDFYKIDPRFGSNESFTELLQQAKKMELKWVKDVVLNHCGSKHWWMSDLPFKNWINYEGKFVGTHHRREVTRDPHAAKADVRNYLDGWFVPSMPDLNQANPHMATYLIQNSIWWIEKFDLSGFRVDTYPYSDQAFLSKWSGAIMREYPNFSITSEEWTTNPALAAYWQKGKKNANGYVSHVSSPMDFALQDALVKALNEKEEWNNGLIKLYQSLANDFQYADASKLLIFADNHDMSRIYTQLGHDTAKLKMALTVLATMRGIPQLYYGTEVLLANPKSDSHGEIRAEMPGGWPDHPASAFAPNGLSAAQTELLEFTKKLFQFRKTSMAITKGSFLHFIPQEGVYVYFRIAKNEKIAVVINKNTTAKKIDLSRFEELGARTWKSVLDETKNQENILDIKANSANVFNLF